jgi:hypothetical protein
VSSPLASPAESRGRSFPRTERVSARTESWAFITPDLFGDGLRLLPMSPGAWRLCDGDGDPDDDGSVVAYLERDATGIDVVWLHGPARRAHYASIEEVLAAARRMTSGPLPPRNGSAGPSRPIPIPHFSPPAA